VNLLSKRRKLETKLKDIPGLKADVAPYLGGLLSFLLN
jgi:hypothetical protein